MEKAPLLRSQRWHRQSKVIEDCGLPQIDTQDVTKWSKASELARLIVVPASLMMIYAVSAGAAGLMNAVAGKPIPIGYAHVIGLMGILSGVLFVQAVLSPRNS